MTIKVTLERYAFCTIDVEADSFLDAENYLRECEDEIGLKWTYGEPYITRMETR